MKIETIESFVDYYKKVRRRTHWVIKRIPPAQLEWTYKAGKFTLGDLVRHIAAIERWMYGETLQGKPSLYVGCGTELATGYEDVLAYFDEMHQQTLSILYTFSDEDLKQKTKTPTGAAITRWKWLRLLPEHEIHHRAQIYTYLGMLGVEKLPPLYGLTAEEVEGLAGKK